MILRVNFRFHTFLLSSDRTANAPDRCWTFSSDIGEYRVVTTPTPTHRYKTPLYCLFVGGI